MLALTFWAGTQLGATQGSATTDVADTPVSDLSDATEDENAFEEQNC